MKFELPDGGLLSLIILVLGNVAFGIWHASSAWSELRAMRSRVTKLEDRIEQHEDKIERLLSEILQRLSHIEGAVGGRSQHTP